MSLVEPLLDKGQVEELKPATPLIDSLSNLEKSIKELSINYSSYELDGSNDIEFRDSDSSSEINFYGDVYKSLDIKCSTSFQNSLAIGRIDGIIKIFNLENQQETVLKGHTKAINCLQAVKDKYLISGSRDKTIVVWNLESYKIEKTYKGHEEIFCLAANSYLSIFGGSLNEFVIRRWDFWNENEAEPLTRHEDGITCLATSRNNEFLVSGSKDCTLRIWNIRDNKQLGMLRNWSGAIEQIVITEDSKYVIHGAGSNIAVWNFYENKEIKQWYSEMSKALILDITVEKNKALIKHDESTVRIYDYENNDYTDLNEAVIMAAFSKRGNLAYFGIKDNCVAIFDVESSQKVNILKNFNSKINKMMAFGERDQYLACVMENGKIKIHDIFQEEKEGEVLNFQFNWSNSIWTKDENYLIMFHEWKIAVWSFVEEKIIFNYEKSLIGVELSSDEKYLVFGVQGNIYAYSLQDRKEAACFEVKSDNYCFTVSKNNIIAGKSDGSLVVFDIESNHIVDTILGGKHEILLLEINKTNDYIITVDKDQNLIFWNISQKALEESFHYNKKPQFIKIIEKDQSLVIAAENVIEIWSIQEKRKIMSIDENPNPISKLIISEDESMLIFVQSTQVRIWSFEHKKETNLISTDNRIVHIHLTSDNKYIAIKCSDFYARLWSCEEKRFIATIENGEAYWKFTPDNKRIFWNNGINTTVGNLEKYTTSINYNPFINRGYDDKILRQRFTNWIKNPAKEFYDKQFIDKVVYPIRCNLLHVLCIQDSVDLLSAALKDGAEIFRDNQNMSPLSYALLKSSRRCIDEILNYVIGIEDEQKLIDSIHQIRDDIPHLFNTKSRFLVEFLEVLFMRRADKDKIGFYQVSEELPISIFSPIPRIHTSSFTGENNDSENKGVNLIQFWGSPLGYNYVAGSDESLLLLKKFDECENHEIFQTLFVQSVIKEKWDLLWPAIIVQSIIYWLNLIAMIWHLFDPNIYVLISFIILNGILGIYEVLQLITKPKDYISEIWNLIDWLRMILSFVWAFFEIYNKNIEGLVSSVVLFNFFRGLTYFRALDFTRFYVRLILMALSDSFAFLVIFLYSTLAFGVLYASLDTHLSFSDMWTMAYELNMGNFDNNGFSFLQYSCFTLASLINVVMMLNLLVSTLGDTFDRFQMMTDELNSKEMLQLVLEFESIMFWARSEQSKLSNKGKLMYLQRCDIFQDSDMPDKWQGKIKELSLQIYGLKDEILGIKKNVSGELRKTEENIEENIGKVINEEIIKSQDATNKKIGQLEEKIELMRQDWEPKMIGIMEKLEEISAKLKT